MPRTLAGDVELYYEVDGAGDTVVFVSGTGWSGEHWKLRQVPRFRESFQTLTFDHRGCGRSQRPPGTYSTRMFAQDLANLLNVTGIARPVQVVGHSMGGRVAQWLALDHPELVRSMVLAASGPGLIDDRAVVRGISPEEIVGYMELGWPAVVEEELRSEFMFHKPQPAVIEEFLATHRGQFGTDALSYLRHVVARYEHQTADRLGEITQPCLVIVGRHDTHSASSRAGHFETSEYLARHLPNAELAIVEDAGHALHVESASEFNERVVDFLLRN